MPGFKSETRTIGGKEITVRSLPMGKGRALLMRLMSILAPSVGEALQSGADIKTALGAEKHALIAGGLVKALGDRLDDATVSYAAEVLGEVSSAKVDGGAVLKLEKEAVRDSVFDGDYMAFFEWLAFAVEVQYRDFFVGLMSRLGSAEAEKAPSA